MTEEPVRRGTMLDLLLTSQEGFVGIVKIKGSLSCYDHEIVEFKVVRVVRRIESKLTSLTRTSGEQTLASTGTHLVKYCVTKYWKGGPRKLSNI